MPFYIVSYNLYVDPLTKTLFIIIRINDYNFDTNPIRTASFSFA